MFNVFSVQNKNFENIDEMINLDNLVETGLSSGEIRQSILDRARQNIKKNHTETIENFIKNNSQYTNIKELSKEQLEETFEEILYNVNNDKIDKVLFNFRIDPIFIVFEEEE